MDPKRMIDEQLLTAMQDTAYERARETGLMLTKVARNFIKQGMIPEDDVSIFAMALTFVKFCKAKSLPNEQIIEYSKTVNPFEHEGCRECNQS